MKFSSIPNYLVFICLYVVLIYRYLLRFDGDFAMSLKCNVKMQIEAGRMKVASVLLLSWCAFRLSEAFQCTLEFR
jgi:hypothetical protein